MSETKKEEKIAGEMEIASQEEESDEDFDAMMDSAAKQLDKKIEMPVESQQTDSTILPN